MHKLLVVMLAVTWGWSAKPLPAQQSDAGSKIEIGHIDFFGYGGLDARTLPNRLPIRVGDSVTYGDLGRIRPEIQKVVQEVTGRPATDVTAVCCDSANHLIIYIGLSGTSTRSIPSVAAMHGSEHLDPKAMKLYDQYGDAMEKAVQRGTSREDWSNGYALSVDPATREIQLKVRSYAVSRGADFERVLRHSGDAQQRSVSAYFLGYAKRSPAQLQALIQAASDSDNEVRNNAVRALVVLSSAANSEPLEIEDAHPIVNLLFSGKWTDRNKGSLLLAKLTTQRNAAVLDQLEKNALPPLIEGARWENLGHSAPFLLILGRIGKLPDSEIEKLTGAGDKEKIIQAAEGQ